MGDMHVEEQEEASRLSFSNLVPMIDDNISVSFPKQYSPTTSTDDQFFEFFTSQTLPIYSSQAVVFCGKIIHQEEEEEVEVNEYRKRDYLANMRLRWRSHSFHGGPAITTAVPKDISGSTRFSTGPNISALTSMSAKSRRRMFMFGPVKFKPEMELSQIKHRLRRPEPMAAAGGKGGGGSSGRRLWGLVRSNLKLTRPFSCLLPAEIKVF